MRTLRNRIKLIIRRIIGKKLFEKINIRRQLGYWADIDHPRTFCEYLSRLKLYDTDPQYVEYSDKYLVRKYVKEKIGEEYLSKLYAVIRSPEEIPEELPESFVLKATYGSGINHFVEAYTNEQRDLLMTKANKMLRTRSLFWNLSGQWWYSRVESRLIAEERIYDKRCNVPIDYKFFCFAGVPYFIQVDIDRFSAHSRCYYDLNWDLQNFTSTYPMGQVLEAPRMLEEMSALAMKLSENLPFVRVDFYNPTGEKRIIFGEMTFAPEAGWIRFYPEQMEPDLMFGNLWKEGLTRLQQ